MKCKKNLIIKIKYFPASACNTFIAVPHDAFGTWINLCNGFHAVLEWLLRSVLAVFYASKLNKSTTVARKRKERIEETRLWGKIERKLQLDRNEDDKPAQKKNYC